MGLAVCTYAPLFFLPAQHGLIHRQNVTAQRFHQGLLYPSIVSAKWTDYRTPSHSELHISYSEPTVFENYVHDIYVDDQIVELSLWDTAEIPRTGGV
jgi:GTPase SAR1 family protein